MESPLPFLRRPSPGRPAVVLHAAPLLEKEHEIGALILSQRGGSSWTTGRPSPN